MKHIMLAAATATLAFTSVAHASDNDNTYFWLHPKLGMVRVNKSTNAMVTTLQAKEERASPSDKEAKTILWIDPKGNVRRISATPK